MITSCSAHSTRTGWDRRLAVLQQRQILFVELAEKIACRLSGRKLVTDQFAQRLVLAGAIGSPRSARRRPREPEILHPRGVR